MLRGTHAPLAERAASFALVVMLHAAVLFALWQYAPLRSAMTQTATLMVSLIRPAPIVPPAPPEVIEAPKPLPVAPRPKAKPKPVPRVEPNRIIATPQSAPAPVPMMVEPPPPEPPAPAPMMVAPPPEPPAPASAMAAPPAPAPIVPPSFNADYLDNPAPDYPAQSRRLSEEGRVVLRVFVAADGSAQIVEIRHSSGYARLDRAAREAVAAWRFVPARSGEEKVAAWVLVPISFTLNE